MNRETVLSISWRIFIGTSDGIDWNKYKSLGKTFILTASTLCARSKKGIRYHLIISYLRILIREVEFLVVIKLESFKILILKYFSSVAFQSIPNSDLHKVFGTNLNNRSWDFLEFTI